MRPKRLPKYVVVGGCPCPRQLAPVLLQIQRETGCHYNSIYRGDDALELLHSLGKRSQRELYHGFVNHLPGYYPANPPGFGTHELRNDGTAYSQWRRGARIPWWACGIDVNDSDVKAFIRAAAKHRWTVAQTYPGSRPEYHHINFRKPPLLKRAKARIQSRRIP